MKLVIYDQFGNVFGIASDYVLSVLIDPKSSVVYYTCWNKKKDCLERHEIKRDEYNSIFKLEI